MHNFFFFFFVYVCRDDDKLKWLLSMKETSLSVGFVLAKCDSLALKAVSLNVPIDWGRKWSSFSFPEQIDEVTQRELRLIFIENNHFSISMLFLEIFFTFLTIYRLEWSPKFKSRHTLSVRESIRLKLKFTHQKALIFSLNYWFFVSNEKVLFTSSLKTFAIGKWSWGLEKDLRSLSVISHEGTFKISSDKCCGWRSII